MSTTEKDSSQEDNMSRRKPFYKLNSFHHSKSQSILPSNGEYSPNTKINNITIVNATNGGITAFNKTTNNNQDLQPEKALPARVPYQPKNIFQISANFKNLPTTPALTVVANRTKSISGSFISKKKNGTAVPTKQKDLATSVLASKKSSDVVTVGELQNILESLKTSTDQYKTSSTISSTNEKAIASVSTSKKAAFPQQTQATPQMIQVGTTISSLVVGMLLGFTIFPNLWLLGSLMCLVFFGDATVVMEEEKQDPATLRQNGRKSIPPSRFVYRCGKLLATYYCFLKDSWAGLWFLYKTGQLSYAYYKQFESLDSRFALTDKIDAWNARFQKGKENFDAWEKQNEIGSKVLASLRTIWLVEQQSLKKYGGRKSRYRLVQYFYNALGWVQRAWIHMWSEGPAELRELWRGILVQASITAAETSVWTRLQSSAVTFFLFQSLGALFALQSWYVCLCFALAVGWIWPTWRSEVGEQLGEVVLDLREQGREQWDNIQQEPIKKTTRGRQTARIDRRRYPYSARKTKQMRSSNIFGVPQSRQKRIREPRKSSRRLSRLLRRKQMERPIQHQWGVLGLMLSGGQYDTV